MVTQRLKELKMQRSHFLLLNIRHKFVSSKLIKFSHLKNIFVISIIFFVSKEDKAKLFKLIQKEKLILFTLLILNEVKLNLLNFNIYIT